MKSAIWRSNLQSVLVEEPAIAIPDEIGRTFQAHHGLIFRTAYRITGNAADAEDVLQTVFLRLLRRPKQAEAVENEESYLRRAAINAALDIVRSRTDDRSLELMDVPSSIAGAEGRELRQALRLALGKLNPRSAQIFALRFFEGFDNKEIARMLGISQVLVAVLVHRTRQQLRKELAAYSGDKP